jgi:L-fucose isomerase-like protein
VPETKESILGEATAVNINDRTLSLTAKFELALKDLVARKQLSGLGLQCWPSLGPMYGIAACSTMGRLTSQGIMASCEVDILGALDMIVQYNMALRRTVPFFIDWTIQHRTRDNTLLAWHCGNGPARLHKPGTDVILRNRRRALTDPIPDADVGAGVWEFTLAEGPVTISRLVEYEGEFKMLVANGKVIEDPRRERGTSAWVEVDDLRNLYSTLVEEGFLHHASMIHGDLRKPLEQFCKLAGIKVISA